MVKKVALIDYGAGNIHSVHNALKTAGADNVLVTNSAADIKDADHIVLPGVGAFGACSAALYNASGVVSALEEAVLTRGVPFLGICVGMQLLADQGLEQGTHKGLGWIGGTVKAIEPTGDIKVPHMGWNDVTASERAELMETGEAYFLHGYHFEVADEAHVYASTSHGGSLVAAVGRDNILGVQFHPEKSQAYGLNFLSRFLEWKL